MNSEFNVSRSVESSSEETVEEEVKKRSTFEKDPEKILPTNYSGSLFEPADEVSQ